MLGTLGRKWHVPGITIPSIIGIVVDLDRFDWRYFIRQLGLFFRGGRLLHLGASGMERRSHLFLGSSVGAVVASGVGHREMHGRATAFGILADAHQTLGDGSWCRLVKTGGCGWISTTNGDRRLPAAREKQERILGGIVKLTPGIRDGLDIGIELRSLKDLEEELGRRS